MRMIAGWAEGVKKRGAPGRRSGRCAIQLGMRLSGNGGPPAGRRRGREDGCDDGHAGRGGGRRASAGVHWPDSLPQSMTTKGWPLALTPELMWMRESPVAGAVGLETGGIVMSLLVV